MVESAILSILTQQASDYKAYNYGCEYADKIEKEKL